MIKFVAIASLAALVTACASHAPTVSSDPGLSSRGSTANGEATAAQMGFHGPVYRANKTDGPN